MISFTVPGVPVAKARARVTMQGGFARAYTPQKTADYESLVGLFAKQSMIHAGIRNPFDGPVSVTIEAFFPVPNAWSKKKKALLSKCHVSQETRHFNTSKPDTDNIAKLVNDAMNGIVFIDDSQVCEVIARKFYGDRARLTVVIVPL